MTLFRIFCDNVNVMRGRGNSYGEILKLPSFHICVCKTNSGAGDCFEIYEFTPNFQVQSLRIGGKICVPQAHEVAILDEVGVVGA